MSQPPDAASYISDLNTARQEKDEFFAHSPHSPLPREQRGNDFHGLSYFAPDLDYRVSAQVEPIEPPETVQLGTSTGEPRSMVRFARLRFQIAGVELTLTGFANPGEYEPDELFIPFQDATSSRETYGAGRYLEVAIERTGPTTTALVDFNLAYNPYCAYSPLYSCPVPPRENRLSAPVKAGERALEEH
ncbi:MAG TPA: DUF1684 domain-containing protein [Ktedonobacterales bacterium]|nr:DUF1684 domain-containing protein [Ktedonobacterales bacterium]